MDTDASLVSSDILFQLREKTINSLKNDENTPIFKTVSGQELHSLGKYEFPITINKNHTFNHTFYVMNSLKENCILGIDFLSQHNVKINTTNKQINYDHAASEQLLEIECLRNITNHHTISHIISLREKRLRYPITLLHPITHIKLIKTQ
jgi:hypothetical protein